MRIHIGIQLDTGEEAKVAELDAQALADKYREELGADLVTCQVFPPPQMGTAGTPPEIAAPPIEPPA